MTLADEGFLDLPPSRLEYRMIGPRPDAAPTIVMLHEGLGCVGLWGAFPEQLASATGAGVFVYSRAGYGKSSLGKLPRSINFMDEEALDVLPRVLAAIGFQRGILFGHSDGASIATIYAGSVQDHRVRGLVLMAPHFFTEEMGLAAIRRTRDEFAAGALREKLKRWHDDVDCAFYSWNGPWLDPEFRQMGYHRSARLYPRADPGRAGRGRPIRHDQAGRGGAGGVLLPGRDGDPAGRAPFAPSRRPRARRSKPPASFINRLLRDHHESKRADDLGLRPDAL